MIVEWPKILVTCMYNPFELQWWKEEWSYSLQRFKIDEDITAFTRWKLKNSNCLHYESCFKSCGTITQHSVLCDKCQRSHNHCPSKHGMRLVVNLKAPSDF